MPGKKNKLINRLLKRQPMFIGASFLILLILFFGIPVLFENFSKGKIYPNISIGSVKIGNLTENQAKFALQQAWNQINESGMEFWLQNERVIIYPIVRAPGDPDQTYDLITFELSETLNLALALGHKGSYFDKLLLFYRNLFQEQKLNPKFLINNTKLIEALHDNFFHQEKTAQNAGFQFIKGQVELIKESKGQVIDYDQVIFDLQNNLLQLENIPIILSLKIDQPQIFVSEIEHLSEKAQEIALLAPFTLTARYYDAGRSFSWQKVVPATTSLSWIVPKKINNQINLSLGEQAKDYLLKKTGEINREPLDAKFEISNNRITQFQASRDGLEVDIEESYIKLTDDIINKKQSTSQLILKAILPQLPTAKVNDLGIQEIIGIGKSNFAGSPENRQHNIKVSSDKLNGLLIAPDEEFSLVKALKPFTRAAGYLPELVIKGNRLIPEIGGGACQIGTTTFRAAISSGLPITKRRNHSFAVSYYNDENGLPGTDATIYDPLPDLRFINDTGSHILIQTHIEGDELIYEFWGASDGRQASSTTPVILDKTPAPNTKYIETEDLKPGNTKCSGSNIPGYNTTFTYTITTSDSEIIKRDFNSHYRPWQRVCLIGIEKKSEPVEEVD